MGAYFADPVDWAGIGLLLLGAGIVAALYVIRRQP